MSRKYKFKDQSKPYFVTFTVVNWIDLFTRKEYTEVLIDSIKFCQKEKGLIVYAWVVMPSHVHMIIGTRSKEMQNTLRDLKSYTSRKLKEEIKSHPQESRKEWLIWMFERAGKKNGNNSNWQLWQQDNQPIELWDNYMIDNKLNYLHQNPVNARIVNNAEDYVYSSAADYAEQKGIINVELLQ
ncbi:MAG: transposase [Vicingus serpentipes]|nr:transposase [Vicingus serpentipes]